VKLNHLDLHISDVPALTRFLVDGFDLVAMTRLDSPKLAVLGDGHGFTLVLQRQRHADDRYPDGAHIGFLVDDPADVHARRAKLAAAGADVSPVETDARGTRCYCRAPAGVLIEVGCNAGSRIAVPAGY
jgi:catechol 2,3-dioxygenase-like lactoylglutathione lyase family enzyme